VTRRTEYAAREAKLIENTATSGWDWPVKRPPQTSNRIVRMAQKPHAD
jgi:hypothetical protein